MRPPGARTLFLAVLGLALQACTPLSPVATDRKLEVLDQLPDDIPRRTPMPRSC